MCFSVWFLLQHCILNAWFKLVVLLARYWPYVIAVNEEVKVVSLVKMLSDHNLSI